MVPYPITPLSLDRLHKLHEIHQGRVWHWERGDEIEKYMAALIIGSMQVLDRSMVHILLQDWGFAQRFVNVFADIVHEQHKAEVKYNRHSSIVEVDGYTTKLKIHTIQSVEMGRFRGLRGPIFVYVDSHKVKYDTLRLAEYIAIESTTPVLVNQHVPRP
jgi:hypothetical protein